MDHIKAAEDSFSRANNFYILMWVVTALVVVTAFVDFRSHRLESQRNDDVISFYSGLEKDAARLALEIRSFVYLQPGYENEQKAIDGLRRDRGAMFASVRKVFKTMAEPGVELTVDERKSINEPLNLLGGMLLLNDITDPINAEFPFIEGAAALRLAEHSPGSYLIADKIENLRIEDALRYHWVTTLEMRGWLAALEQLNRAIVEKGKLKDVFG